MALINVSECSRGVSEELAESGGITLDGLFDSMREMTDSCGTTPSGEPRWVQHGSIFMNDTNRIAVGLPRVRLRRPDMVDSEVLPYIRCIQEAGCIVAVCTPDQRLMIIYEKNELNVVASLRSDPAKWAVIQRLISLPGVRNIGASCVDPNRVSYVKRVEEADGGGPVLRLWGGLEYVEVWGNDVYSVTAEQSVIDEIMADYPASYSYVTREQLREIRITRRLPFGFHAVPVIADFLLGVL